MNQTKAMILGAGGLKLSADEKAFYTEQQPWGFILFGRNISPDPSQIADLVAEMRDCVRRPDAPVLIDQEGGRVQRIREPLCPRYPSGAALGQLYGRDRSVGLHAAFLMSRLHAFDLLKLGINVDCLPVLDVPVEGASNVIGDRAYGNQPAIVTDLGRAAANGLKAGGVLPVMKHIPGHGRGFADSHHQLPIVDTPLSELMAHDFPPFMALKDELMAMSAHIVFSAIDPDNPATTSRKVIGDIIRGIIGFDGLLISDDVSMNALQGSISERARDISASGVDIILHCNGVMEEMKAVAEMANVLEGKAAERAGRVQAAFGFTDGADEAALRAEFEAIMAVA